MNLQIRLVAIADNGQEQVHEIASLQRTELQLETLGLTLAEGKTILREIQRVVVERQVAECLEPYRHCCRLWAAPARQGAARFAHADGLRQNDDPQPAHRILRLPAS
jgi:hypothetical protein